MLVQRQVSFDLAGSSVVSQSGSEGSLCLAYILVSGLALGAF